MSVECPINNCEYTSESRGGVNRHLGQSHSEGAVRNALLNEIRQLADGEKPPTAHEMDENGKYTHRTYENHFGTWNEALGEAGYGVNHTRNVLAEELVDEIHRLADGESPPTRDEVHDNGEYSVTPYRTCFGTWNAALKAAGYTPTCVIDVPEEDLLAEIHRLADGETAPIRHEMDKDGRYASGTYKNRFGTWNEALEEAGYEPNLRRNVPDGELIAEIRRLADGSTPPTRPEMNERGKYSGRTCQNRFGSWTKALEAAGFDVSGYVYIAERNQRPRVKIGETCDVERRMDYLTRATGHEITAREAIHVPNSIAVEHQLHDDFTDSREYGEWFDLTDGELDTLIARIRRLDGLPGYCLYDSEGSSHVTVTDGGDDE